MNNNLLTNFYSETATTFSEANQHNFNVTIALNPNHEIYKGHFAQIPIAPGVCLMQLVKEILMAKFQQKLMLTEGKNLKFLALINPNDTPHFQLDFVVNKTDAMIDASVNFQTNGTSYTKMRLIFKYV